MKTFTKIAAGTITAGLLSSTAAFADITAAEAWQDWKDLVEGFGQSITATETMSGNTLTVSDTKLLISLPDGTISMGLGTITFAENGDGTVTITTPEQTTMTVSARPENDESLDMTLSLSHSGYQTIASGEGDARRYVSSGDTIKLVVTEMIVDDKPVDMDMSMDMTGLTGTYMFSGGDAPTFATEGTVASMSYVINGLDDESGAKVSMTSNQSNLVSSAIINLVDGASFEDPAGALNAGFSADLKATYGAGDFTMNVIEGSDAMQFKGAVAGSSLGVAINKDQLAYSLGYDGADITVSGSEIPLPQVNVKIADADIALAMPVSKSDAPQDFALLTSFKGLEVDNMIWSMFDPVGQLPRDPANIVIDLSGTGQWKIDLLSEDAAKMDDVPGEVNSLKIKALELAVAGARLTGLGDLTFDNSDLSSYDGMPKPVGAVSLMLTGGNKLLDTLVNMGLVPQDQAMGVRMMSGMVARPGDGEDTLVSEIEFTEQGGINANGMPLK